MCYCLFSIEYALALTREKSEGYSDLLFLLTSFFSLQEKIESATDVLKAILKPVVDEVEEIPWPPRDPEALKLMERVCFNLGLVEPISFFIFRRSRK